MPARALAEKFEDAQSTTLMLKGATTVPHSRPIVPRPPIFVYDLSRVLHVVCACRNNGRFVDRTDLTKLFRLCGQLPRNFSQKKLEKLLQSSVALVAGYVCEPTNSVPKRRLVTFTHATGDGVAVACVERVLVHPDFAEEGLLTQTIQKITHDLQHLGICEILAITSDQNQELFGRCGYGPDPEASERLYLPPTCDTFVQCATRNAEADYRRK